MRGAEAQALRRPRLLGLLGALEREGIVALCAREGALFKPLVNLLPHDGRRRVQRGSADARLLRRRRLTQRHALARL